MIHTRRQFLTTFSLAGAAGLVRAAPSLAAEGALETTTVRIVKTPAICLALQYVSEELLRAEGFTDIRYLHIQLWDEALQIEQVLGDFPTIQINWLITLIDIGVP